MFLPRQPQLKVARAFQPVTGVWPIAIAGLVFAPPLVSACHCEERSDEAIQLEFNQTNLR